MNKEYVKRKLKGMSMEQKRQYYQELSNKALLAGWRKWGLKACRNAAEGKEPDSSRELSTGKEDS